VLLAVAACTSAFAAEPNPQPSTLNPQPSLDSQPTRRFAKPAKAEEKAAESGPALTADDQPAQTKTLQWRAPRRPTQPPYRLTSNSAPRSTESKSAWSPKHSEVADNAGGDPFSDPFGDGSAIRRQFARPSSGQAQPSQSPSDVLPLPGEQRQPTLEEQIAQMPPGTLPPCPSPNDLKPINEILNSIAAQEGVFPPECSLGNPRYEPRQFCATTYTWKASGLCHKPLYFEEMALERYGHTWGPVPQPIVSAAHFFGSVILLPYQMGVHPPQECIYDLGYYRYGNCAPQILYTPPLSLRGAVAEGLIWTGAVFAIP
jgi:hypothetical protein